MIEAWAYAKQADDGGWHAIVANGNGGDGFLIAQNGNRWAVLVGGVGGTSLGAVEAGKWTHLAVVKTRGQVTGWLNGKKVCTLPDLGGGADNFFHRRDVAREGSFQWLDCGGALFHIQTGRI